MISRLQILSSEFWGIFGIRQSVKFLTLHHGGMPYVGGTLGLLKVKEACQFVDRKAAVDLCQICFVSRNFLGCQIFHQHSRYVYSEQVSITPTSRCWAQYSRTEDYDLKVRSTLRFSGRKAKHDPLLHGLILFPNKLHPGRRYSGKIL